MTTTADLVRQDRLAAQYGVVESGMPVGHEYHEAVSYSDEMTLGELVRQGGKVTRVRLLTEVWPGQGRIADVSYVHGTLPSGKVVPIRVGVDNGAPLRSLSGEFVEWAKAERVYAKSCGLLDRANWSILY